jgi:putative ABC transport system permease protein
MMSIRSAMRRLVWWIRAKGLLADIVYAGRTLRSSIGFTVAAVATLAIGIGATTAIYSVVDGVLFKPLAFSNPGRVVALYQNDRKKSVDHDNVAPANFADWRERSRSFAELAAAEPFALNYSGPEGVEQIYNWNVTEDFFRVLDARPALGRLFVPADFTPGSLRVLILTYASWQTRFGADPAIIGRRLLIGRGSATVIGVLPANFAYLASSKMELYAPKVLSPNERQIRNTAWYNIVGRLKPGVSLDAARSDVTRIGLQLSNEYPATNATVGVTVEQLGDAIAGDARRPLTLLFGAVVLVLLIACVNVANLTLARGARRRRELAVRSALGASRWRIAQQLMTEHALVAGAGGLVGVVGAAVTVRLIRTASLLSVPRLADVQLDARALAFTLVTVVVVTLLFGLLPVIKSTSLDAAVELRAGTRASGDTRRGRVRRGLVIAEVALAFVLLVGAGLLMRSFVSVLRSDRGYKSDHVLAATIFVYQWNPTPRARASFVAALVHAAAAIPGVTSAGATSSLPLDIAIGADQGTFTIGGRSVAAGQEPSAHMTAVTPTAFDALRVPLLRGRPFTSADDSASAPVVVINESMARRYWPDSDPIGQRVRFAFYSTVLERTVVGIVADTRQRALDVPPEPILYVPHAQAPTGAMVVVLRTAGEPRNVLRDFRRIVSTLNPALPLAGVETLDELAAASVKPREFVLTLLGAFAACAFILALVGVYAVINQGVLERRGEIGVRVALGALPASIVRMVIGQGVGLAAVGVVLGGAGAVAVTGLLRGMLVGVQPFDAPTFAIAASIMVIVAALASAFPAMRASGVDPVEALRAN